MFFGDKLLIAAATMACIILIAALLALGYFGIKAHNDTVAACEQSGRHYVQTGERTTTTLVTIGKVLVPQTQTIPIYSCVE